MLLFFDFYFLREFGSGLALVLTWDTGIFSCSFFAGAGRLLLSAGGGLVAFVVLAGAGLIFGVGTKVICTCWLLAMDGFLSALRLNGFAQEKTKGTNER